jgi:hypothetical protein
VVHHGGEIWAEAAPVDTGARMVFYIPIGERALDADTQSAATAPDHA